MDFLRMHIQVSCVLYLDFLGKTCKELHLENRYKSSNDMTTVSLLQCSWPDAYLSQKLVKWISLKNLTAVIKRLEHLLLFPCTIVHVKHHNFDKQRDFKSLVHHTSNQKCNHAMEILTLCLSFNQSQHSSAIRMQKRAAIGWKVTRKLHIVTLRRRQQVCAYFTYTPLC